MVNATFPYDLAGEAAGRPESGRGKHSCPTSRALKPAAWFLPVVLAATATGCSQPAVRQDPSPQPAPATSVAAPTTAASTPATGASTTPTSPTAARPAVAAASAAGPPARAADVATIDAIITALYASISGPANSPRDWDRFRSLFAPGARLIPMARPAGGTPVPRVITPDEYVERSGPMLTRYGFTEREIARRVDRFGLIAHVFSTYEGRFQAPDAPGTPPRGINSIQLAWDGTRWWVVTVFWDSERPEQPIPAEYLRTPAPATN